MTSRGGSCRRCSAPIGGTDRFCGACGASAAEVRTITVGRSARDQAEVEGLVLITDRGLEHPHNEDAAAGGVVSGAGGSGRTAVVAVVCDGVSTSGDAASAAVTASTAGADAMLTALAAGHSGESAAIVGLTAAARAAAGVRTSHPIAASCTYTAAVVVPEPDGTVQMTIGNVGDTRAYWLPADAPARLLTVDDSVARELIDAGLSPDSEAVQSGAHTLTRWLGADAEPAPWSGHAVQTLHTADRGRLVLCSDGLWNYLPDPEEMTRICAASRTSDAAGALVDFALRAGGEDNITVAVIPIGGLDECF